MHLLERFNSSLTIDEIIAYEYRKINDFRYVKINNRKIRISIRNIVGIRIIEANDITGYTVRISMASSVCDE